MNALEKLRLCRWAERRRGGDCLARQGQTWYETVNYWIDQAVADGYSDRDILAAMQVHHAAEEGGVTMPRSKTERLYDRIVELQATNKQLAKALNKTRGFLLMWEDALAGVQMSEADFDRDSGVAEALAALNPGKESPAATP